ncbi:hypothetical protein NL676_035349 [Syzygium grande]|nr:hypothetical protein NL676_035349 [Syzygium grande]
MAVRLAAAAGPQPAAFRRFFRLPPPVFLGAPGHHGLSLRFFAGCYCRFASEAPPPAPASSSPPRPGPSPLARPPPSHCRPALAPPVSPVKPGRRPCPGQRPAQQVSIIEPRPPHPALAPPRRPYRPANRLRRRRHHATLKPNPPPAVTTAPSASR